MHTDTLKAAMTSNNFVQYERVRLLDKMGFSQSQEAYSLLLPSGWTYEDAIIWNNPGSGCDGTFKQLSAWSADKRYQFHMYPDIVFSWNSNQQLMQFNQSYGNRSPYCGFGQPVQAAQYLRQFFIPELGNPQLLETTDNPSVVQEMQQSNEANIRELQQYGAGQIRYDQTAINATLRWPNGTDAMVVLGVSVAEMAVPNMYNGTYDVLYTTQVSRRTLFTYPATESEQARELFSVILSSFRTNPAWSNAVSQFWRDVRQQKQVAHIGRIQLMDEQTRLMGQQAIRNGQERLQQMDQQQRSWEQQQAAQDRAHKEFVKAIREVENYQDASGKYEMSSGYAHAWSRGDGSSFIMTNDPNFNPATYFQDQQWKEMKKVD